MQTDANRRKSMNEKFSSNIKVKHIMAVESDPAKLNYLVSNYADKLEYIFGDVHVFQKGFWMRARPRICTHVRPYSIFYLCVV